MLIDHFPSWMTDGLFSQMDWAPWAGEVDPHALDMEYFGNRSGCRECSPLVDKMVNQNGYIISPENSRRLTNIIRALYGENWGRLWTAIKVEYNPLENYSMTETRKLTGKDVTKEEIERAGIIDTDTTSNVDEDSTVGEITSEGNGGGTSGVVPLNGSNPVTIANSTATSSTSNTAQTNTGNTVTVQNSVTDTTDNETRDGSIDRTEDIETTRSGNIGVTTSQQMLDSEFELRKRNYFDYVFTCVDEVLTIPYWR